MSLTRINHNITAMNAQRNLSLNTNRVGQSMERLSSGLRINRAADDPAGLVMSETLRAQISGMDVVQQNVSEGVNLIKTAEGALTEVNSLLRQINDLALDSASNSTNTADTRSALQRQVESALNTINKIANNTKYAGLNLLDGSAGTAATTLDTTNIASAQLSSSAAAGYASVNVTSAATKASHDGTNTYATAATALDNAGTITINGTSIGTFATTDKVQTVVDAINAKTGQTGVTATWDTDHVQLDQAGFGSDKGIIYVETADVLNGGSTAVKYGTDAAATVTGGAAGTYNQGKGLQLKDAAGDIINLTAAGNSVANHANAVYVTQGSVSFQIGLTASETASTTISSCTATALGINGTDIATVAGAQTALTAIADAIKNVSSLRGQLGAFQSNELEAQGRSLATARENLAASESAIRDTDFGEEMAEYSTAQILVQSATAFLAQANSLPQNVLQLIQG
ncbi:hypothetical protein LLH03_19530 [bacterium]|nr:hypothetical protein [bacterium]